MNKKREDISESIYSFGKGLGIAFLVMAILSFLILLLPFFLPNVYDYQTLGTLGDTVGGFLNPLIAIAAALLTFLAFFIQYQANQYQRKSIELQKKDLELARFENNFFEMMRLHKENVNEMKISGYEMEFIQTLTPGNSQSPNNYSRSRTTKVTDGRKVFVTMNTELYSCFQICKFFLKNKDEHEVKKIAFQIFFYGINSEVIDKKCISKEVIKKLKEVREIHYDSYGETNRIRLLLNDVHKEKDMPKVVGELVKLYFKYRPFSGHESRLGHYYRHLFSCVNYVVDNEKKGLFEYSTSRHYLKILRSQLSNDEQLLLYYNYLLGAGAEWDKSGKRGNDFFTKYRMIHNIPIERVKIVDPPQSHFSDYIKNNFAELINDPLFEWGDT